ncbi:MAG TPA: M50 family metallopeptidase [Patescibacteria group bacterium]|nr:M50 family metallopeptidase [Patescibacteria group bacterium]
MLGSILIFLLVLSLLILIHEFGHFIVAIKFGIPVLEFGFGLPPRIIGKKIGNTVFSINAIPFGGFVRLFGENDEEERHVFTGLGKRGVAEGELPKSKYFINKPKRVRALVTIAGVVMNFILAIVAFGIVYSFAGIPRNTGKLEVVDVAAGSPAQSAGVVVGDVITKVEKDSVTKVDDFISLVNTKKGKRVSIEVQRNETTLKLSMVPREAPPEGEGPLGVTITTTEIYFPPFWQRPFYGIYYGFKEALFWGQTIVVGLWTIIVQAFNGKVPQGIAGPVGIFAVTTEAARSGVMTLINFIGVLSLNLAILNILPFPALDGGRLLFIGIESIVGRKVLPRVEATIHSIGMVILLALLLAVTVGDIKRVILNGGIDGFIESFVR